jgi:hypothetical protein
MPRMGWREIRIGAAAIVSHLAVRQVVIPRSEATAAGADRKSLRADASHQTELRRWRDCASTPNAPVRSAKASSIRLNPLSARLFVGKA